MIPLLALFQSAWAGCPASTASLSAKVEAAEISFVSMKAEPFQVSLAAAEEEVACLNEVVSPQLAARLHRVRAYSMFLARDQAGTVRAFRAQISSNDELGLPDKYPEGHPLRLNYEEGRQMLDPHISVKLWEGTKMYVDGYEGAERPIQRTALLQVTDDRGTVLDSGLYGLGDAFSPPRNPNPGAGAVATGVLPRPAPASTKPAPTAEPKPAPEAVAVGPKPAPKPTPEPKVPREKKPISLFSGDIDMVPVGLGAAAGAALITSAVLFASSSSVKNRYEDPTTPYEDLDKLRNRTNGLGITAQLLTVSAVGLGGAAVVTGVF